MAELKEMMRVWSGRTRGKHQGSRTGAVRGDTSAAFAVMPGAICGDSRRCSR